MSGIVAFVLNDVEHDSRVRREAASLRAAGHEVTIVGRTRDPYAAAAAHGATPEGVPLVRVPVASGIRRWLLLARRPAALRAAAATELRAEPLLFGLTAVTALAVALLLAIVVVPVGILAVLLGRVPVLGRAWQGVSWRVRWRFVVEPWARAAAQAAGAAAPGAAVFWAHDMWALPAAIAARGSAGVGSIVYDAHEIFTEAGDHARRPRWAKRQMVGLERRLAATAQALVTVNELLAERLGSELGLRRVIVARNAPPRWHGDPAKSPLRAAASVPADAPLLLYHGGLAAGRGIETLVACLAQPGLERAHLVFMGFGLWRGRVARLAAEHPRVHLLPPVAPEVLLDWVSGADVVVAPIQPTTLNHRLSSPNKVFEGIAAGVPVVGSDLPGIRSVLFADPDEPLGALGDPDDPAAFARAIRGVIDRSPAEAAELRARCQAAADERWNWETESADVLALAAELDPIEMNAGSAPQDAASTPGPEGASICFVLGSTGEFDARTWRLAEGLAARGHDVTIVARAADGLPDAQAPGPCIRLLRVDAGRAAPGPRWSGPLRLLGEARRIADVIGQVRRQARSTEALDLRPDLVQAMGFLALPVAAAVARRAGARLIYDARDLYVESNNIARLPAPLRGLFAWQEGRLARAADRVITVNDSCADYLQRHYRVERPIVVMNGQLPYRPPRPAPDRLRQRLGLAKDRRIVLYHGGFMRDRGLLQLVEAVASTRMSDVDLVFMGSGPEEGHVRGIVGTLAARDRIHFLPPVPPAELLDWVASADVGAMVNQPTTLNEQLSTPNKLFECITAGTPVVSSDFPERRRIVLDGADGPLGRVCDPTDPGAIAAAIRSILDLDVAEARALRQRCLAAGRGRLGWAAQFEHALEAYADVTGRPW